MSDIIYIENLKEEIVDLKRELLDLKDQIELGHDTLNRINCVMNRGHHTDSAFVTIKVIMKQYTDRYFPETAFRELFLKVTTKS